MAIYTDWRIKFKKILTTFNRIWLIRFPFFPNCFSNLATLLDEGIDSKSLSNK